MQYPFNYIHRYVHIRIRVKHFTCTIEIHASWIWCPLFSSRIYGISCYFAGKKLQNEKKVKVGKSWPFFGPFLLKTISCRRRALLFVYCLSLKNDNIYSAAGYYLGGIHKLGWHNFEDFDPPPLYLQVYWISKCCIVDFWVTPSLPLACQHCL